MTTISDERLAEMTIKSSQNPNMQDETAAFRELQALRAQGGVRVSAPLHDTLQRWRDEDHEDTVALSREQVIDLCEEYRAAALPHMGGVRVKPLEWTRGWMNAEAQTEIGQYIITYRRDGSFEWGIGILKGWASSWDEAKSAAQADYERRILSAIEASPAPVSEEMVRASVVSGPVPADHPLMVAWKAYVSTDEYANTFRWAQHEEHREGSLWAAFEQGYRAALAAKGGQ